MSETLDIVQRFFMKVRYYLQIKRDNCIGSPRPAAVLLSSPRAEQMFAFRLKVDWPMLKGIQFMKLDFIECPEVAGKQIEALRIYRDTGEGTELQIDFPDGTSFTCSFATKPEVEASMIRPGVGPPEIIRKYDLD